MSRAGIRKEKRHKIYARDGYRCVYCNSQGSTLTLDHLKPKCRFSGVLVVRGRQHDSRNLVTACLRCNSSRQDKPLRRFCLIIATRTGQDWKTVWLRVVASRRRKLERKSNQTNLDSGNTGARPVAHRDQVHDDRGTRLYLHDECSRDEVLETVASSPQDAGESGPSANHRAVQGFEREVESWRSSLRIAASTPFRVDAVCSTGCWGSEGAPRSYEAGVDPSVCAGVLGERSAAS